MAERKNPGCGARATLGAEAKAQQRGLTSEREQVQTGGVPVEVVRRAPQGLQSVRQARTAQYWTAPSRRWMLARNDSGSRVTNPS